MPNPIPAQRPRRAVEIATVLLIGLIGVFYLWTATTGADRFGFELKSNDLYNRLADGFLGGQLSFRELPNPAIARLTDPWDPAQNGPLRQFHDVSYYKGRYYLYFGATPAVTLLMPWRILFGSYLQQNVASVVLCLVALCAAVGTVLTLRQRYFPDSPRWMAGSFVIALAFATFVPPLLRRPVYYEVAISCAYAFGSLSLYALLRSLRPSPARRWWLAIAGLTYGCAIAARPSYLFGAVVLLAPFYPKLKTWKALSPAERKPMIRDVSFALGPLALMGLLLATYNQLRFGSPTEFGTYYMFSGAHPQKEIVTSFDFLPTNLWFYVFSSAQFTVYFPFVEVIKIPWFHLPPGYSGEENVYGLLPNLPVFWSLAFVPRLLRDHSISNAPLRNFAIGLLALCAANALVLLRVGGAANRYMVDLFFPLSVLACLAVLWIDARLSGGWRRVVRGLWIGAVAYTTFLTFFVSLQHNELFRIHNPVTYSKFAHAFNSISQWFGQTSPQKTGPIKIQLEFPRDRKGQLQPLVVTGHSFRADFLYVFYTDDRRIQFGFEHTSYGGAMTKPPIEIDYGKEHTLEISMGSFYPPVDHPFFDGVAAAEIARQKRTLRIVLDGKEVLTGDYEFYDSSPGEVSVGFNPVQDAFGRRFTGRIISAERVQSSP